MWRSGGRVTEVQRLLHTLMVERYIQGRIETDDAASSVIHSNEEQSTLREGKGRERKGGFRGGLNKGNSIFVRNLRCEMFALFGTN